MRAETKLALTMPNRRTSERNIKLVLEYCRAGRRKTKLIATEELTPSRMPLKLASKWLRREGRKAKGLKDAKRLNRQGQGWEMEEFTQSTST